ncbi:MAG: acyl transferase [Reichenbachiella sp.]|uniref:LuxE/PaaK family acyltransferase n=1 Tax=Reichenbachiella sp. TaxID=2184521 RepID=UPI002965FFEE|nr:acyl transferase [Reichenbachiella sp.]MDW3210200.1 acyl transferase [Reichenbachiella sp.]
MKLLNSFKIKSSKVNSQSFDEVAMGLFHYQAEECVVYREYLDYLNIDHKLIHDLNEVPFLPIDFFKSHQVRTDNWEEQEVYLSSGTTGSERSKHYIEDPSFYLSNAELIFEQLYGSLSAYQFFALLPSYQEQGHSSLVKMVDHFINKGVKGREGGFYLNRLDDLLYDLQRALSFRDKSVVLFGVGYALLDLVDRAKATGIKLDGLFIIETGGMKGRRKDMVKSEFYAILKEGLGKVQVHSEYGMTELLSQAYSFNEKTYKVPAQMKILIRDPEDPFFYLESGKTGGINVIDLANVHSCAFVETKDLGRLLENGEFEILGRLDNSDIRGCNLMVV